MGVRLSLSAVLSKSIDDLGITAALAVLGAHHRHRRQEWDTDRTITVEASRQHDRLAGDIDQLMLGRGDTSLSGQPQRDLFPGLHAVVVSLLRKLGDGEMTMLVDDRRLRTRTAKGGAWGKDELQVFIRFLIPEDPFGDLEQPAKFYQGRNARTDRRLESLFADPAEAECAKSGLVGDTEQVVAFYKRANRAAFPVGETAFGALHETPAPGIRR